MGRKKKWSDPFKSVDGAGGKNHSFARLCETMAFSPTYQKLSDSAKVTLMCCKLCRKFHTREDNIISNDPLKFYFNRELQRRFGLKNPNKCRKSMIELVEAGFIECCFLGWNTREKDIFRFSYKWQWTDRGQEWELSTTSQAFIKGHSQ